MILRESLKTIAFLYMKNYILRSSYYFIKDSEDYNLSWGSLKPDNYLFTETILPGEFRVNFALTEGTKQVYYDYGFVVDKNSVMEEWLKKNTKTGITKNEEYKSLYERISMGVEDIVIKYKPIHIVDDIEISLPGYIV